MRGGRRTNSLHRLYLAKAFALVTAGVVFSFHLHTVSTRAALRGVRPALTRSGTTITDAERAEALDKNSAKIQTQDMQLTWLQGGVDPANKHQEAETHQERALQEVSRVRTILSKALGPARVSCEATEKISIEKYIRSELAVQHACELLDYPIQTRLLEHTEHGPKFPVLKAMRDEIKHCMLGDGGCCTSSDVGAQTALPQAGGSNMKRKRCLFPGAGLLEKRRADFRFAEQLQKETKQLVDDLVRYMRTDRARWFHPDKVHPSQADRIKIQAEEVYKRLQNSMGVLMQGLYTRDTDLDLHRGKVLRELIAHDLAARDDIQIVDGVAVAAASSEEQYWNKKHNWCKEKKELGFGKKAAEFGKQQYNDSQNGINGNGGNPLQDNSQHAATSTTGTCRENLLPDRPLKRARIVFALPV
ncbi:unnamed protein product [Amoebophrya sp. A120]|nr:unnamed protein product [Amoebophrya sp. A120]|eukprot:GSA120T00012252001.1